MRTLVVALVLVLAGCNGLSGDTATETVTPVDPPPPEQTYPPGVSETGVVNPDLLASAHGDRLWAHSYVLVSNRTTRTANGSLRSRLSLRVAVARNRTYHAWVRTAGPDGPVLLGRPPARAQFWADGDTYVRTLTRDGGTVYNEILGGDRTVATWQFWTQTAAFGGGAGSARRTVRDVTASFPMSVADTDERGGTRYYVLVGDGAVSGEFAPASVSSVRNASVRLTVTGEGVVTELRLGYTGVVDGRTIVVDRSFEYEKVNGTTVARPAWYDRAVAQSNESANQSANASGGA